MKFQTQISTVARFRERKKGEEKNAEDAELDPLHTRFRRIGADLGSQLGQVDAGKDLEVDRGDGDLTSSTGTPESDSGPRPEMIPAQSPSPRASLDKHQHLESSFD